MLVNHANSKAWKEIFIKKFSNFAKKAPIKIGYILTVQDGRECVIVSHDNSGKKYAFPINYDTQVKDFISDIKKVLVANHYPRLIDQSFEKYELTPEEQVAKLEEGVTSVDKIDKFELRLSGERLYRIDKTLLWKNIAILVLEQSTFDGDLSDIGKAFQYSYNGSLVMFLNKYRSGKFPLDSLSREWFDNAGLIRTLDNLSVNG
jgi:hypothetical protein